MINLKCIDCGDLLICKSYSEVAETKEKIYYYDCEKYYSINHQYLQISVCSNSEVAETKEKIYYYDCEKYYSINHQYLQISVCSNKIIGYSVDFYAESKIFDIKSVINYPNYPKTILRQNYQKLLSIPKFYPLDISDWISDFEKVKTDLLKLSIFV